ncbi:MAG: PHP domain-containing protein [archaeon]|nr:PHP domain-containing protein [archaeon]MCP8306101.1 PHP domain-containing protein [archaeon]
MIEIKIDFHVHTQWSHDAFGDLSEISRWARFKGIDVVVVTDHEKITLSKPEVFNSVKFIPGIEVKTIYGHVLGVDIRGALDMEFLKDNPVDAIHESGGISVLAHPFDTSRGKKPQRSMKIDAIEVINASVLLFNFNFRQSRAYAKMLGLPETAGSDSHMPPTVGDAFVEVEDTDFDGAMRSVIKGRGRVFGRPTSMANKIKLNLLRLTKRSHSSFIVKQDSHK